MTQRLQIIGMGLIIAFQIAILALILMQPEPPTYDTSFSMLGMSVDSAERAATEAKDACKRSLMFD